MKLVQILTTIYRRYFHFYSHLNGYYWKLFLKKAGKRLKIAYNVRIQSPHNIEIGNDVFINFDTIVDGHGKVIIGNNVRVGYRALLITANHKFDSSADLRNNILKAKNIVIKDNCWLGSNCIILPGITINNNSIVGAGAVVTKTFPSNSVIAGNPARVVKKRPQLNDK